MGKRVGRVGVGSMVALLNRWPKKMTLQKCLEQSLEGSRGAAMRGSVLRGRLWGPGGGVCLSGGG